jgi:hypothetical protein
LFYILSPIIIYKEISLNFYFVDVNLTPLQPHHKIEKGKNKNKKMGCSQNVGLDSTTRKCPQVVHPSALPSNFLFFLNGEVNEALG